MFVQLARAAPRALSAPLEQVFMLVGGGSSPGMVLPAGAVMVNVAGRIRSGVPKRFWVSSVKMNFRRDLLVVSRSSVSWHLPRHEVKPFARNTLAAVIMQLRFHPILKVADRISDFQERVRPRFPGYEKVDGQSFEVTPGGNVQVRNETAHRFLHAGEPAIVTLATNAVSVEYLAHKDRQIMLRDVAVVIDALVATYAPVSTVRLGLRYVNVINRERIARDLRRQVEWSDLMTADFARVPAGLADIDDASFVSDVSAPCSRGGMTIRYGLLRSVSPQNAMEFRLDTDRFLEGSFETTEIQELLDGFSSDIFQVFMTAAGGALFEWMAIE